MQKWLNVGQSEKESDICTFTVVTKRDEGRSINTLQNGVILSILNTWKSENTRFVGNEEWQYYDVYLQQSVSAIFCSSFFFHKSLSVDGNYHQNSFKHLSLVTVYERTDSCDHCIIKTTDKVSWTWFSDKKVFMVQTPTNTQNDRVYATGSQNLLSIKSPTC